MTIEELSRAELRLNLHPGTLGFADTSELVQLTLHWIGQERAEQAARLGLPMRISAHTHAGQGGVLNIEREMDMSGPIHDKGVLILQSHPARLPPRLPFG
jgi:hypothetical protein